MSVQALTSASLRCQHRRRAGTRRRAAEEVAVLVRRAHVAATATERVAPFGCPHTSACAPGPQRAVLRPTLERTQAAAAGPSGRRTDCGACANGGGVIRRAGEHVAAHDGRLSVIAGHTSSVDRGPPLPIFPSQYSGALTQAEIGDAPQTSACGMKSEPDGLQPPPPRASVCSLGRCWNTA
eukprot:365694-Chlamydomonas_euryale.AAC.17